VSSSYLEILRATAAAANGPHAEIVRLLPRLFSTLANLLDQPVLDSPTRRIVSAALGYLVAPFDAMPDDAETGFVDDVLVALLACRWVKKHCGPAVLDDAWPGDEDLSIRVDSWYDDARTALAGMELGVLEYVGLDDLSV
jgi:uncharacterized membrane protein YkvA (DUF1232 family)